MTATRKFLPAPGCGRCPQVAAWLLSLYWERGSARWSCDDCLAESARSLLREAGMPFSLPGTAGGARQGHLMARPVTFALSGERELAVAGEKQEGAREEWRQVLGRARADATDPADCAGARCRGLPLHQGHVFLRTSSLREGMLITMNVVMGANPDRSLWAEDRRYRVLRIEQEPPPLAAWGILYAEHVPEEEEEEGSGG